MNRIFKLDQRQQNWTRILLWWEIRRPLYNLFLALVLGLVFVIASTIPNDGFFYFQAGPMLSIGIYTTILLYFLVGNICYTGGSIVQMIARTWWTVIIGKYLDRLFIYGLVFSFLVSIIPLALLFLNFVLGQLFKGVH